MHDFFDFLTELGSNVLLRRDSNPGKNEVYNSYNPIEKFLVWLLSVIVLLFFCGVLWFIGFLIWHFLGFIITKAGLTFLIHVGGIIGGIFILGAITFFIGKIGTKSCNMISSVKKLSADIEKED